jgi:serine/threonine protein kinase
MSRPSRIAIVKELGSRVPRCLAAHAVRGEGEPELVVVERYPASLGAEVLSIVEQDAKDLASFHHQNVAAVISTAKLKGDVAVLSEWVDGESLTTLLGAQEKAPLPVLLRAFIDVLEALGALHASGGGRVCGALTSDDVFVGMDGVTRITRFGLSRVALDVLGPRRKVYAPPELARGERTARGDVFVAGVVLWECLTGEPASRDVTWGISPPDVSKLETWSKGLVAVIEKACAIEPNERYATPGEMARAVGLDAIVGTRAGVAQHVARVFGERIAARLSKLEPKSDVRLPSINAPMTTEPPPAIEIAKPALPTPEKAPEKASEKTLAAKQADKPPEKAPEKPPEKAQEKPPEKAPEKTPEKPAAVDRTADKPEKAAAAARKPAVDPGGAALARKAVPLPKRVVPPVAETRAEPEPPRKPEPAKVNGTAAAKAAAKPLASSPKTSMAKPAQQPEPAPAPSREELDIDVELASLHPPPPVPDKADVSPPSSREEVDASDVDVDIVSVRPPPTPPKREAKAIAPAPADEPISIASDNEEQDHAQPKKRGRAWLVVLVGILFFGGGFFAGRFTMTDAPAPVPTMPSAEPSHPAMTATVTSAVTSVTAPALSVSASASATHDRPVFTARPVDTSVDAGRPAASSSAPRYDPNGI